jgi:hypothetical protein
MGVHIDRAFTRSPVECSARVKLENTAFCITLLDELSQGGCRLQTDEPLAPGTHIAFKLPDLDELRAKVIWHLDQNVGCEFVRPISATDVRHTVNASMISGPSASRDARSFKSRANAEAPLINGLAAHSGRPWRDNSFTSGAATA